LKREHLEEFLERGISLGFRKATDDPRYLGWIRLSKRKPDERHLAMLAPGEEPRFVAEQEILRSKPYFVLVIELSREVIASDRYETMDDYRVFEQHYFADPDEVEKIIGRYECALEDIRWLHEIEAP